MSFSIGYAVTDSDGDVAPGTLTFSVDDDTPVIAGAYFEQEFDDGSTAGFLDAYDGRYGNIVAQGSGSNGIATKSGNGSYALVTQSDDSGPNTNFGQSSSTFGSGFKTSVDVWLDANPASGAGHIANG